MTDHTGNNETLDATNLASYASDEQKTQPEIRKVAFQQLTEPERKSFNRGIPVEFHNVSLVLGAELGKVTIKVFDLINLIVGSVLKLERVADEKVTILANGTPFAHGEIVVINDRFGVRVTALVSEDDDKGETPGPGKEA